jgi:hypothetical protein
MSPAEAKRLVGHSPDIVERLNAPQIRLGKDTVRQLVLDGPSTMQLLRDAAAEIERLRTALRSVREILRQARYQTDLGWADQRVSDALEIISNALREDRT